MIREVGPNAHSISDQTQGPWNGIVGRLLLSPVDVAGFCAVDVYSDFIRRSALVSATVFNSSDIDQLCTLSVHTIPSSCDRTLSIVIPHKGRYVSHLQLTGLHLDYWDEFSPKLEHVEIILRSERGRELDRKTFDVGLREVRKDGKHIMLNGNRIFLRGTVECCVFPKTGSPPTDEKEWERIYKKAKEYGLNHIRFHSWCPPEAAFAAADKIGIYLQVECPIWKNQGVSYSIDDTAFIDWLYCESERIVTEYGNHPSFLFFASGNEPDGQDAEILGLWAASWNLRDQRRLHTSSSGWPAVEENAYQVVPEPRIQAWGEGLASRINGKAPETCTDYSGICDKYPGPVVTHEMGQWCVFPDFSELDEYTGYLKPKNFEIFLDILKRRGMEKQASEFLMASGKQQVLCYKEEIESALRTENLAGFQLLALTDFPGQGTALEGVLNAFWQEKGYCDSIMFRRFCNDIVLLARLPRRTYVSEESFTFSIELAAFGSTALCHSIVRWSLRFVDGTVHEEGECRLEDSLRPGLHRIDTISVSCPICDSPQRMTLAVSLEAPWRENSWDIWVYPSHVECDMSGIYVARTWDDECRRRLAIGERVLLVAAPQMVCNDVELGFSSAFWNTSWTGGQAPHTLGMVINDDHPVFADFVTDSCSDWQWWELVHGASAMVLDDMPRQVIPLVQPIDTWFRSHKLALLFECRVGDGRLMVCSMDILSDLDQRIVARQLMHSIGTYMSGDDFNPACSLQVDDVTLLFSREVR
jgi:hypothetical protein